jgi:F-type H+-transporting ATPase subunit b
MENLGIDPKQLIAQMINFALFYLLFTKLIAKPLAAYIQKRKTEDLQREKDLAAAHKAHIAAKSESDALIAKAKSEAADILEKAKIAARQTADELLKQAKEQANAIQKQALASAQEAKKHALQEAQQQIRAQAQHLVEEKLRTALDADTQRRLLQML